MKYNCELIQDLLPLYEEGLCSPTSRQIVEQHLCECKDCCRLAAPLPIEEPQEAPAADRAVKKSMRKVRRRWLTSLVAAVLLVPMLMLSFNQYQGSGLCFTNLDDVYTAWRFLHALETQDWETAANMHDYSDAYDSIQQALGQDVASWSITAVPMDLQGHDYMAKAYLSEYDAIPATLSDLYSFLYNRRGSAMVPTDLWEQLMELDPGAIRQEGWQYWLNGELYGKITTDWGEFVVIDCRSYDTAYDYAHHFDLIPAAIYEEARPAIEAEAQRLYTTAHSSIGWVAALTEAEFAEEMTRRYLSDLNTLTDNVTFDCTGFLSAGRILEEGWHVIFSATVTQGRNTLDTQIQISVRDGKITVAGISYPTAALWLDAIDRALYPSAHPGY